MVGGGEDGDFGGGGEDGDSGGGAGGGSGGGGGGVASATVASAAMTLERGVWTGRGKPQVAE